MDQTTLPSPSPPSFRIVPDYDDNDPLVMAKRRTGAFSLAEATPGEVPWLWPGRIPLGGVTLLVSDPGVGKSLLALDIAARVTRGAPWPDQPSVECRMGNAEFSTDTQNSELPTPHSALPTAPSSVLLINIEDHFLYTIRPRLDALGAECSRIIGWTSAGGRILDADKLHLFALTHDLDRLEKLIEAMKDCRLVILDPVSALVGDSSGKSSADAWKLLAVLVRLARCYNFAVLAISHLRKKQGSFLHRALGSLAFVAAARSVWTITKDTDDPDKRLLLPVKNNLAHRTPGLAFTVETSPANNAAVIRWLPDLIEATADIVLTTALPRGRPDAERQFAIDWLKARLADNAVPYKDVRSDADAHGIAYGTLRRAFQDVGAEVIKQGTVKHGPWTWRLPGQDAQKSEGGIVRTLTDSR